MTKLFCDLKTDEEKSAFFLSGRGYETGVIAHSIQNDVAMAYHRCAEYQKELKALQSQAMDAVPPPTTPPDGWQLVPKRPTVAMLEAAQKAWLNDTMRRTTTLWDAMLAAAPKDAEAWQARAAIRALIPKEPPCGT